MRNSIATPTRQFSTLLKPTTPVFNSTLISQERPKLDGASILPPVNSNFTGGDYNSTRSLLNEATRKDTSRDRIKEKSEKEKKSPSSSNSTVDTKSVPFKDELNTLLRHPALYDPILAPRYPIVLCHGKPFS